MLDFVVVVVFLCFLETHLLSQPETNLTSWSVRVRDSALNWAGTSGSGCNSAGETEEVAQSRPDSSKKICPQVPCHRRAINSWKVGVFICCFRMAETKTDEVASWHFSGLTVRIIKCLLIISQYHAPLMRMPYAFFWLKRNSINHAHNIEETHTNFFISAMPWSKIWYQFNGEFIEGAHNSRYFLIKVGTHH